MTIHFFNSTLRLSNLREILDQREKLIKHRESELDEKVRAEVRGILSTAEEEREERLKLLRKEEERVNDLKEILEKKKKGEGGLKRMPMAMINIGGFTDDFMTDDV